MRFHQKKLFLLALLLFLGWYSLRLQSTPVYQIPEKTEVIVRGDITHQPYLKGSYQIIHLGPVLIKTGRFPQYFYNQKIEVVGKFEKRVIGHFQVQYFAYFPTIRVIEKGETELKELNLQTYLLRVRGKIEETIEKLLPEPQASLLLGIVFGAKKQMPREFWQSLQKTGTLHIVVASGQNVSMVAKFLIGALVWVVNRKKAILVAITGVFFYILMVGAEPPVVRAGIMAVVGYVAQFLGKEEEGTIALLVAVSMMLLVSPLMLFDIGFQLSFAATAGLIWIYPILIGDDGGECKAIQKFFKLPIFGEAMAVTIAAQLAVMPILLINFGQASFLSPIVNSLVLWVVPPVMVLGSTVALLALIVKPLAQLLAWFVWLLLAYFVKIIEISGNLPWVSLKVGEISGWWVLGYYSAVTFLVIRHSRRQRALVRRKKDEL